MSVLSVVIGGEHFPARLRDDLAPDTCARFRAMLPWSDRILHARWSGEGCWISLASTEELLGAYENATSHPRPGEFVFYPGGKSEAEIFLAYGSVSFASKAGPLAGNPFLAITENLDRLAEVGHDIFLNGSRKIEFR